MQRPEPLARPWRDSHPSATRSPFGALADAERGLLDALAHIDARSLDPRHYLENERARRTFLDVGLEGLCHHAHPVTRTVADHLVLFQLLDWPRAHGGTLAEALAAELDTRRSRRAALTHSLARARLVFVRVASRADTRAGLEEVGGTRRFHAHFPSECSLQPGDAVITRFAESRPDLTLAVADLLMVPYASVAEVEARRRDEAAVAGPDPRTTDAARLFQAWAQVTFGNDAGVIDPADHAASLEQGL